MNGMAASDKIFRLLDLEETKPEITESFPSGHTIRCSGLSSYEPDRRSSIALILTFPQGSFTALVGESGCGKSTLASILMGRNKGYTGSVSVGGVPFPPFRKKAFCETSPISATKATCSRARCGRTCLWENPALPMKNCGQCFPG